MGGRTRQHRLNISTRPLTERAKALTGMELGICSILPLQILVGTWAPSILASHERPTTDSGDPLGHFTTPPHKHPHCTQTPQFMLSLFFPVEGNLGYLKHHRMTSSQRCSVNTITSTIHYSTQIDYINVNHPTLGANKASEPPSFPREQSVVPTTS